MNTIRINRKKLNRNINLNYLFTFIRNLDMSSSIWVLYLAYKGMNLLEIGILEGIYHVTSMMFEVPSGAVADLLGRKKTMVAGRIGITLSCICMLFADGFWGFALGFFLQALSNTLNSGADEALLYDSMKLCGREEEYLKVNGRLNILVEISQAIAVVVGGILAECSYTWCYGVSILIALLGFVVAMFLAEAPVAEAVVVLGGTRLKSHFSRSFNILRENARIRNVVIYYSAIFTAYTLLFFYSQQYFSDMGLNKVHISLIMLVAGGASCLGAACSEKLYKRFGDKLVTICAVIIAAGIGIFSFRHLAVAIVTMVFTSFCNSLLYPIQSITLNRLIPSEQRATLISVNSMAFSVGMVILFPTVGALADYFGLPVVLGGLGIMLIVGVMAVGRMKL